MIYPVCAVSDAVECRTDVRAWYFCGEAAGANAGGLFDDFPAPLRFEGYRDCDGQWCVVVSGRADRKEVARNAQGVAIATGLVSDGGFRDGMEPLDQNSPSTCTFSMVVN